MAFLPPLSLGNVVVTALQLLLVFTVGVQEVKVPTAYSKFAAKMTAKYPISARSGMLLAYVPALMYATWDFGADTSAIRRIVAVCLILHFGKRVLEVLFLHVYSGGADFGVMMPIGVYYTFITAIILHASSAGSFPEDNFSQSPVFLIGCLVFLAGELGNLYHHCLLAQFRTSSKSNAIRAGSNGQYVLPSGGLFDFVTMPHYFCELVAFYGLVMIAPRLNILLAAFSFTSYLTGRSTSTTAWYKEKFGDHWPRNRKHIIPFIY